MMDASGFAEDLAAGNVTESMMDELGGVGDESQVREVVARYRDAGVTLPCVGPFGGHPAAAGFVPTLEAAVTA